MGPTIRKLREECGLTQEELARKSGVSRGTISAIELNAQKTTTTKTLEKIATALNTTVDRFFYVGGV